MTPAVCYGEPQPKLSIVSRKNKASELMVIENECGVSYDDNKDDSDDENDDANENKNLVSLIDFLDMPVKRKCYVCGAAKANFSFPTESQKLLRWCIMLRCQVYETVGFVIRMYDSSFFRLHP